MSISFRGVMKRFGAKEVLSGVDLEVEKGEILFIVGTSGAGKSVTIKHLVGLLRPDGGEILLDGKRVDHLPERALYPIRKRCAMVFQSSTLFDSMTILENVALPLRKHKGLTQEQAEREASRWLERLHLEEFGSRYPADLGDGTKKRAAIARALTLAPEYVLFDEPTTGLDPVSARRVDKLICDLKRDFGVTSLVVSHDLVSIFTISDRIAMVYKGKIYACGPPHMLKNSDDPIVRQFLSGQAVGPMETPGF